MLAAFTQLALSLINQLGYAGLIIGLIADSAGVPIPSEVLLPLAGALVRTGRFNLVVVIVVATLAQTAGAMIAYWLGATGGIALVERYGKYVLFSERELKLTQRWFNRYGAWLALFGRVVPVIRTYVGYPAGLGRMPFATFVLASLLGSALWSAVLTIAGYQLASRLLLVNDIVGLVSLAIVALLAVGLAIYLKQRQGHKAS